MSMNISSFYSDGDLLNSNGVTGMDVTVIV